MTAVEKRHVPLGTLRGATLISITLENPKARLAFRCSDGTISEVGFSGVDTVTNQAADGMVLERLTEHAMFGSGFPSRFVFENANGSSVLAIRGRMSGPSLLVQPGPVEEAGTGHPFDAALASEDAYSGLLELAGVLAGKSGAVPGALSHEEEVVHSLTGIDLQVSNGGWLQWLHNTEPWRLGRAVADLREIGLPKVAEIVEEVFQITALVDPASRTSEERDELLGRLPEAALRELLALDGPYYHLQEECAQSARRYVLQHVDKFRSPS